MSIKEKLAEIQSGGAKFEHATDVTLAMVQEICDVLKSSSTCTEIVLANVGVDDEGAKLFAEVISSSTTLKKIDLGYNKITGPGVEVIANALAKNTSVTELKLHRQEKEMGRASEEILVAIYGTNTTLTRMYVTLHDRKFNGDNTRGEVRNKEIERRKATGKDWIDLDPARKEEYKAQQEALRKKQAEEEAKANAPISSKIESTGGPYTYKQLTAPREFWPDDVELAKRETYLSDEEFQTVFGMSRADFGKLAGWKKNGLKKDKKLN